jgi:hypothetical protein
MNEVELLSLRVRVLESRFRQVKAIAIIACVVLAALGLMGQVNTPPRVPLTINQLDELQTLPKKPEVQPSAENPVAQASVANEVRAHQITLVDENGRERASLVTDNSGTVFLIMSDAAGKTRVNLSVANDGPSLVFHDPSGQARTILGSTTLVGSHVNDNGIAEIAPASSLVLFDGKGKLLFRTP